MKNAHQKTSPSVNGKTLPPDKPLVFSQTGTQRRNDRFPYKTLTLKASGLSVLPLCGMNMGIDGMQKCLDQKPPPAAPQWRRLRHRLDSTQAALQEPYFAVTVMQPLSSTVPSSPTT